MNIPAINGLQRKCRSDWIPGYGTPKLDSILACTRTFMRVEAEKEREKPAHYSHDTSRAIRVNPVRFCRRVKEKRKLCFCCDFATAFVARRSSLSIHFTVALPSLRHAHFARRHSPVPQSG